MTSLLAVVFFLLGCAAISFVVGMAIVGSIAGWAMEGNLVVTGKSFVRIGGPIIGMFGLLSVGLALVVLKSQRRQEDFGQTPEPEPKPTNRFGQIEEERLRWLLNQLP